MSKGGGSSIPSDYSIKVGGTGTPLTIDSDLDNIRINNIAPINVNSTLDVKSPIKTESTSDSTTKSDATATVDLTIKPLDLKIEPLKIDSNSNSVIDLKPIAVDSCSTIKIAPLPPMRIEQPYSQHFGFTWMGMELFGFTTSGQYDTLVNNQAKSGPCKCHSQAERDAPGESAAASPVKPPQGGLRVRVNGN
ncbi:MAG: hypothetical protein ABI076_09675 [Acidobacteriaceae bacterium]